MMADAHWLVAGLPFFFLFFFFCSLALLPPKKGIQDEGRGWGEGCVLGWGGEGNQFFDLNADLSKSSKLEGFT